jgi:hypothetical protein
LLAAATPVAPALARAFVLSPVAALAPRLAVACVAFGFPRPAAAAAAAAALSSPSLTRQRNSAFALPPPSVPGHGGGAVSVSVSGSVSPEFTLAGVDHLVFGVALGLQRAYAALAGGAPEPRNLPPLAAQLLGGEGSSGPGGGDSAGGLDSGNSGDSGPAASAVAWASECGRAADFFALLAADEPALRRALAADRAAEKAAADDDDGKKAADVPRFTQAQWRALWRHGGPRRGAGTAAAFEAAWNDAAPV